MWHHYGPITRPTQGVRNRSVIGALKKVINVMSKIKIWKFSAVGSETSQWHCLSVRWLVGWSICHHFVKGLDVNPQSTWFVVKKRGEWWKWLTLMQYKAWIFWTSKFPISRAGWFVSLSAILTSKCKGQEVTLPCCYLYFTWYWLEFGTQLWFIREILGNMP